MIYQRSFVLILTFILCAPLAGQQTPPTSTQQAQRDPQALTVVTQAINAAGGQAALGGIQDVAGSGTITYYWAGDQVQGNVTLKGRGVAQFRLDATLPAGIRSIKANNGTGSTSEPDGTTTPIPFYQAVNMGSSFAFPVGKLLAALQDPTTNITYGGLLTRGGSQVYDIRIAGLQAPAPMASASPTRLPMEEFFIDSTTFHIVSVLSRAYPRDGSLRTRPAELQFSDYRTVNGILVPFSVTNLIDGQCTFTIQLAQVTLNNNLSDSDFQQ
jgi:hypothetical protein